MTNAQHRRRALPIVAIVFASCRIAGPVFSQDPEMLHRHLGVRPVVTGLSLPTTLAFIGNDDILVLEKDSGRVQRIVGGALHSTVLDLAVNSAAERGLLGIALHPRFPADRGVYLYWTCRGTPPPPGSSHVPRKRECADVPELGADTNDVLAVPLLANRIDRFVWDGAALRFDRNLMKIRAFQDDGAPVPKGQRDETQTPAGTHNGGVLTFGADGKLYVFVGDLGRRGQLQNLRFGPTDPDSKKTVPDDQFGGPGPGIEHLAGVVLRLDDDGSAPADNPFYGLGASLGGNTGKTVQKIYAYGFRNSFGMAIDPQTGYLWVQENGDDSFSEINLVERGMNGGWVQIAGPVSRIAQFKGIELTHGARGLQQRRWPPTNIAEIPSQALARLVMFPGARYRDPAFSWKWEVAPGGIGFVTGDGLGAEFAGNLFVGAATPALRGGYLFRFKLTGNGRKIAVSDPRLKDRVADNLSKHDITESESLMIGQNFGIVTDIETGPNGNLFVVSFSRGAIYEIFGH